MLTSTAEDYLKAIRRLEGHRDERLVAVGKIAAELGVTPGTVTMMMRNLSDEKLVDYTPRRGVRLSAIGNREALAVIRRHRLVELFLVEVVGLDWSEVHREAEVLEHVISERLLTRIDELLGHPTHDPHGDPIPDAEGNLPAESPIPEQMLSVVKPGSYQIVRVPDADPEFLNWAQAQRLSPGTRFRLVSHDHPGGVIEIRPLARGSEIVRMSVSAAERILVSAVASV